jgi:hypothetical protein
MKKEYRVFKVSKENFNIRIKIKDKLTLNEALELVGKMAKTDPEFEYCIGNMRFNIYG